MAHADYNCCAVCDCKLHYGGMNSTTKEEICSYCLKNMRELQLNILDIEEFIQWINSNSIEDVKNILIKLKYSFCYYPNELDNTVKLKLKLTKMPCGESLEEYYNKLNIEV